MDTYERKLIERLKILGSQKAPDELKDRVLAAIAAEPTLRIVPRRRVVIAGVVGAALAAAAALALWAGGRGSVPTATGAHQVAEAVLASPNESVDVRDAVELRAWFEERLGAGFDIPDIEDAQLVGGRLAEGGGMLGAIVDFEYHGKRLTYVVSENLDLIEMLQGRDSLVVGTAEGQEVVMWLENWTARAVVAEMPRQELAGIAAQCRRKALS